MPIGARLHLGSGAALLASSLLVALVAAWPAAWPLAFVLLVPWLRALDAASTLRARLALGAAMAVGYCAGALGWFGVALATYTGLPAAAGVALLLLAAPLLQPQFLAYALVRHLAGRAHGPVVGALLAAAAWVGAERFLPRLLGDTLGYALYPAESLRQAADLGGAAGLTLVLLLANEAASAAWARRGAGWAAAGRPAAVALALPLLLAAYGQATLAGLREAGGTPLRMGLVQSNLVDYERLRREKGAGAVVREVLDLHFAMSHDAVERQGAQAVLWPETVYPTTFGQPKSEAGAAFDQEILDTMAAARVPFVFGTYDRDAAGEYNAAAFVAPDGGRAMYRKARPFPFTERVPAWLDGPALRRWLPWAGGWQAGDGARVVPLRLADGRELPVLPLVCLDAADPRLALDGARLGAQAILSLSNDAWFPAQGARLHFAVAAFRSIETRLPQFRATADGYSGLIDAAGRVVAGSQRGERTLVVGELAVRPPAETLVVRWGDWVGVVAAVVLALAAAAALWRRRQAPGAPATPPGAPHVVRVAVLRPAARWAAGLLRLAGRASLLAMGATAVFGDGSWQVDVAGQVRSFAVFFLAPELAAWLLLRAHAAQAQVQDGALVLTRGSQQLRLGSGEIAALVPWRVPLPGAGARLQLATGGAWRWELAVADPAALARALGVPAPQGRLDGYAATLPPRRGRLAHPLAKFVLLPLLLAIPAFRLHQVISYGSGLGGVLAGGWAAYLKGFVVWWVSWAIAVVLVAAAVRLLVEAALLVAALVRPAAAAAGRRPAEALALAVPWLGVPAWLLWRLLA